MRKESFVKKTILAILLIFCNPLILSGFQFEDQIRRDPPTRPAVFSRLDTNETITGDWTIGNFTISTTLTLDYATASRILATDGAKGVVSVADITAWFAGGSGITVTDDGDGTATISTDGTGDGDITNVTAGSGLTGGGASGSVTLNAIAGTGITVNADDIALTIPVVVSSGGTGQTTQTAAFDSLSPVTTLGDVIYRGASNNLRLAGNTTSTRKFLRQTGTGSVSAAPAWDTVTKTDIGLSNVENTALSTWTGSTAITTLGTIATGTWSGSTIAVNKGGTGATTLTDGGMLFGSGTGAITALGVATNGQIPIGDGTTDPVLATLTAGTGITINNTAGGIEIVNSDPGAGAGDVSGPGSSTDNAIARWDGAGGDTLQDSSVFITDGGALGVGTSGPATPLNVVGTILAEGSTGGIIRLMDTAGAADDKYAEWEADGGTATLRSRTDALTTRVDNILVADLGTGNVGIGTASPSSLFHVDSAGSLPAISSGTVGLFSRTNNSQVSIISGTSFNSILQFGDSGNEDIGYIDYDNADDSMRFGTDAAERVVIDSAGKVGIGTASPGDTLEVTGGFSNLGGGLKLTTSDTSVSASDTLGHITFQAPLESTGSDSILVAAGIRAEAETLFTVSSNSAALVFETAQSETAAEKMRLTGAGLLGIGTASPGELLEVSGATLPTIRVTDTTNGTHDAEDIYGSLEFYTGDVTFGPGAHAKISAVHTRAGTSHSNSDAGLVFYTSATTSNLTPTERMRIMAVTGNVGIGTTSPGSFWSQAYSLVVGGSGNDGLTIYSSSGAGTGRLAFADTVSATAGLSSGGLITYHHGNTEFTFRAENADIMTMEAGGKVGIGTASPGQLLDVSGTGQVRAKVQTTTANQNAYVEIANDVGAWLVGVRGDKSDNFTIHDNSAGGNDDVFVIDVADGNVGIGTTSPTTSLQLGDHSQTGFSPNFTRKLLSSMSVSSASGNDLNSLIFSEQTAATTGSIQGIEGYMVATHASGTVVGMYNVIGNTELDGAGNVTWARGIGGSVGTGDDATGTITNAAVLYGGNGWNTGSGSITNYYGLYVEGITAGSGTNYSIYTAGTSPSRFGGTVTAPVLNASTGFQLNTTATSGNVLRGNGTNFVSAKLAGTDITGLVIGTDIQAYDSDLAALAANSTNGLWARTGTGTGSARTITGTTNEITVTNGNGVSGNPTLSLPDDIKVNTVTSTTIFTSLDLRSTIAISFSDNSGNVRAIMSAAGGWQFGSPTGGDKGLGTINAKAVYDDNSILSDALWDLYYDGKVRPEDEKEWGDARLWNIEETVAYTKENRHLPTMPGRDEWIANGSSSLGQLVTGLWKTVELQQMQIIELQRQIKEVKNERQ